MAQIGKPRGLIDYCTSDDAEVEKKGGTGAPVMKTLFRPRTMIYLGIWAAIGAGMAFTLGQRTRLDLNVQHDRNPVFVTLSDGSIRNNYTVKVRNMEARPRDVTLHINGLPDGVVWSADGSRETAGQSVSVSVAPDSVQKVRLFVAAPVKGPESTEFSISAHASSGEDKGDTDSVQFERPAGGE